MTLKIDAKFQEKLICCFKNDKNLVNFDPITRKSHNLHFHWFLLCKVFNVWTEKVQRSYLSWHWRLIQNLERNRLVVSKLTWGIWRILTRALESVKNFHFNRLLLSKVYIAWAKKNTEKLSFMTLKSDAKFEEKLTCGLENDMSNLANFHQSTLKCQNWDFDGILLSKVENVWA